MPTVSVSHVEPEWRILAEKLHLVVERQFHAPSNVEALATACGLIVTRSRKDLRLAPDQVPVCQACQALGPSLTGIDAYLAARTS